MRRSDLVPRAQGAALLLRFAVCALARPEPAFAQAAEPVELTWVAPEGCPTESAVRARVRELAGSTSMSGTPLRAEGTVTRREDDFRLELAIHAGDLTGSRTIEGRSCADLAGAAAVALVLLLRSPEPLGQDELAGSAGREIAPATPRPAQKAAQEPARRWRGLVQVPLLSVGFGPIGGVNLGAGLGAGVAIEPWRFTVEGRGWLRRQVTTESDLEQYGADLDRQGVTLRACRTLLRSTVELSPCLSLSLEHLTARGFGPQIAPSSDGALWVSIGAGGQARLPIAPWLTFVAALDAQFQTSRPEIVIDGVGTVEQVGPIAATVTVGPEWIL